MQIDIVIQLFITIYYVDFLYNNFANEKVLTDSKISIQIKNM